MLIRSWPKSKHIECFPWWWADCSIGQSRWLPSRVRLCSGFLPTALVGSVWVSPLIVEKCFENAGGCDLARCK